MHFQLCCVQVGILDRIASPLLIRATPEVQRELRFSDHHDQYLDLIRGRSGEMQRCRVSIVQLPWYCVGGSIQARYGNRGNRFHGHSMSSKNTPKIRSRRFANAYGTASTTFRVLNSYLSVDDLQSLGLSNSATLPSIHNEVALNRCNRCWYVLQRMNQNQTMRN
jgi:hypothetical protein